LFGRDNKTMQFDPKAAKDIYSELPTDELVRIALFDSHYVAEAKKLAEEELARRKFHVEQRTLEQVRARLERRRAESLERELASLEAEDDMPSWRRFAHRRLARYRTPLTLLVLAACAFIKLGLLGLDGRKSTAVVTLLLLAWLLLLLPSREEAKRQMSQNSE
jgi:hypothetical protein